MILNYFWMDFGMELRLYLQYHGMVGVAMPIFLLFGLLLALLAKFEDATEDGSTCLMLKIGQFNIVQ